MSGHHERRQFGRRQHRQHAWIIVPGRPQSPCQVVNVSVKGAFLEMDVPKWLPYEFGLKFDHLPQVIACEIRHSIPSGVGVLFSTHISKTDPKRPRDFIGREIDDWRGPCASSISRNSEVTK